ncbi:MAG TPA: HNH endonuclease [Terriglobia bacterium]|nr:HNH endonuclease [Terriglobia bacterium]
MPKHHDSFYVTPEWRQLVGSIVKERGRKCERCARTHNEAGAPVRIFGDHIQELKDGGAPLDRRNVMLLCGSCHTSKTLAERAKRTAKVWG